MSDIYYSYADYFSYFCTKMFVVGTYSECLTEALLMGTQCMFSCRNKKNIDCLDEKKIP